MLPRLPGIDRSVALWSMFAISSALTYLHFFQQCATPPHVYPMSRYVITRDKFYQALPCVSTASSKHWSNKSDISYLKTRQAFDVLIHSRVLLAAILCWLVTLQAPRVAACFWRFRSRSVSRRLVYVASASQYPS